MKFLFDFFPILCFFLAFKLWGVYVATACTMGASVLQNGLYWLKNKRFEKMQLVALIVILIFGSFTLFFHNPIFIKWKPSIVYWILAILLLWSEFLVKKNALYHLLKDKIEMPFYAWKKLTISWAIFFMFLGSLNLYVAYRFDTNTWVNFKLIGVLGLTVLFIIGQAIYISNHHQS